MTSMLDAVVELAGNGWRVHPCAPSGPRAKAPLLAHGHLEASSDPETIISWWTRWPTAMIGAPVPDSLVVLDIDPRNGGSFDALEDVFGPLPTTLTCWSGRGDGGRHLYYRRPAGELVSTRLPVGVDLKANGYLIVPPSIHPATGEPYTWNQHPVADLPVRAREVLRPRAARHRVGLGTSVGLSKKAEALVRVVAGAPECKRNASLYWAACRALEEGHSESLIDQLHAAALCTGLDSREIERTLASARNKVAVSR